MSDNGPDQTAANIAAVTGSGVGGRPGDADAQRTIDVPPSGATAPDVRPPHPGSVPPSASVDGTETVTERTTIPVAIIDPPPAVTGSEGRRGIKPF